MTKKYIKEIYEIVCNAKPETLAMSMDNVHAKGMFSLVVDGKENGMLTRIFVASKKLRPFEVQLHTHRYPIQIATLTEGITHHVATVNVKNSVPSGLINRNIVRLPRFSYKSPLNGGIGLEYLNETNAQIQSYDLPSLSIFEMNENAFHSMSCRKGSMWVVEEGGFMRDHSYVLGRPFITDGLYTTPGQFQINDMHQKVLRTLKELLNDFKRV